MNFIYIGLGGFLGANVRYLVALWSAKQWGIHFPYGTLIANVLGCFFIAFFLTLTTEWLNIRSEVRLFFAVGFLGSFTTFSSFAYETYYLVGQTGWKPATLNFLADTVLGLLAVILGIYVANLLLKTGA